MLALPRALARQFRVVLRHSLIESRSDGPLVRCRAGERGLMLEACQGDVAVRYHQYGRQAPEDVAFRSSVLAQFEGRSEAPITLELIAAGKGRARWTDGGVPRAIDFETVAPERVPTFPAVPKQFRAMPTALLHALDAAARTTLRDATRLAWTRVQLRGNTGAVVATDGRQLLIQSGFAFPWSDDVLVPRVLAFGSRDLAVDDQPVGVGRTDCHIALRIGPWTFLLAIDTSSRFPKVEEVIPRPSAVTSRLQLHPEDAAFLAASLPKLPGGNDPHAPVTLDLNDPVAVRARADETGPTTELVLARSTRSGPPVRVGMNGSYLLRAVKLGFTEVAVVKADAPLACRDAHRIFVWVPLDQQTIVPPGPDVLRVPSVANRSPVPSNPVERRKPVMPPTQPNGARPEAGNVPGPSPDRGGLAELIEEAETLRTMLHDAASRTTRLLAALKQQRRHSRALEAAVASLRQLRLGP